MRIKRIDEIESYIIEKKSVSLDELCEKFGISKVTLRRDLDEVVARGTAEKVYGGVVAVQPQKQSLDGLVSYEKRNIKNLEEKNRIARMAAATIHDNDVIYLDSGTTTLHLIDYLPEVSNLTIITNNVLVASKLLSHPDVKTIVLPGTVNTRTASLIGSSCQEYLRRCHIPKAYMACTAINEAGAFNSSMEECEIKQVAMEQSERHYLLADHTKFDRSALLVYSPLDRFDRIFTDAAPSEKYRELFREKGIQTDCASDISGF